MTTTQGTTVVKGVEEKEGTYVQRKGRFLIFFETKWWERVSERHIGNDLFIETTRPIRQVYLNGEPLREQIESVLLEDRNKTKTDMNYERISHTHCWNQNGNPPCGIPMEKHTQCCLCDLPYNAKGKL